MTDGRSLLLADSCCRKASRLLLRGPRWSQTQQHPSRCGLQQRQKARGGELLWDDMNIVVLPVSKLAANVKVSRVPCLFLFNCLVEMGTGCGDRFCALSVA